MNNSGRLERQLEGMQNEETDTAPQREVGAEEGLEMEGDTIAKMKEADVRERGGV